MAITRSSVQVWPRACVFFFGDFYFVWCDSEFVQLFDYIFLVNCYNLSQFFFGGVESGSSAKSTTRNKEPGKTDFWGYWTPIGFCPVKISTALHRAFESGRFQVSSLIPSDQRTAFVNKQHPDNVFALLDAISAHPDVLEFTTLTKLGFVPCRIASKLGEMERAGACMHKSVSFRINPPVLYYRADDTETRADAHKFRTMAPCLAYRVIWPTVPLLRWGTAATSSRPQLRSRCALLLGNCFCW